jgi:short-subunit dehydrogenase
MASKRNDLKLKPLARQVMVITGATSGIGLSTARAAAAKGARLVLAARNEDALKAVQQDLKSKGAETAYVVADVGDEGDVRRIVEQAIGRFGGFDTWVNNAGVSIFGPLTQTPLDDHKRLFDTNYWGVVHGSLAAVEHFKTRDGGGALINVGSVLGDLAVPLQGTQAASKHAVKGFNNALRMELMAERAPVSLTLIKPSAIDTPCKDHARNLTDGAVKNPPPVYATPLVAQAILHAAEHGGRELTVGGGGRTVAVLDALAPAVVETLLAFIAPALERDRAGKRRTGGDNLYGAGPDLRERAYYRNVRESSLYSTAQMRPKTTLALALLAGLGAAAAFWLGGRRTAAGGEPPETSPPQPRAGWNGWGMRPAP